MEIFTTSNATILQKSLKQKMLKYAHDHSNTVWWLSSNQYHSCHTVKAAIENAYTIEERRSKSIETVFSIAICHHTGDKWQSKTLFLSIFDPRSSIVDYVFDCRLPGVVVLTKLNIEEFNILRIITPKTKK